MALVKHLFKWMQILLRNQESCLISGGTTTKYFKLEKGIRQGDRISAYLFILVLEIAFIFIKENKNIKGINIFDNIFLYSAYVDDTTFFLRNGVKIYLHLLVSHRLLHLKLSGIINVSK